MLVKLGSATWCNIQIPHRYSRHNAQKLKREARRQVSICTDLHDKIGRISCFRGRCLCLQRSDSRSSLPIVRTLPLPRSPSLQGSTLVAGVTTDFLRESLPDSVSRLTRDQNGGMVDHSTLVKLARNEVCNVRVASILGCEVDVIFVPPNLPLYVAFVCYLGEFVGPRCDHCRPKL